MAGVVTRSIARSVERAIAGSVERSSGFTGPLDSITETLVAAYSTRRLLTSYTGAALRVRRASDDGQLDIGFTSNGDLDVATMVAFAGNGVGANCFIFKWYDQSGNGHDLTQPTALAQPRMVVDGAAELFNTRPTIRTNRLNGWFLGTTSFTGAQPNTRCSVIQILDPANSVNAVFLDSSNPAAAGNSMYMQSTTQMTMFRGTNLAGPNNIVQNMQATAVEVANGASSAFYWNGTAFSGDAGANGYDGLNVGCKRDISLYGEMLCPEVMLFSGAISSTNRTTLTANQKSYYGTP